VIKYLLNKKNTGFSLIELLLVFLLVIGATTTVLKQIKKKKPTIHELIMQIDEVTQKIFLKSILDETPYKVHLFFSENNLLTHIGHTNNMKNNSSKEHILNKKKLDHPFLIHNCIVNGHDEMAIKSKEIWFNFYPEGHCQEVIFTISDNTNSVKYTYNLNPFSGIIED